jgi:hypothetical protein
MAKRIKNSRLSITKHASARMQQRAITDLQIRLIEVFGVGFFQKGGTEKLHINKEMLDRLRRAIDKLENVTLIVDEAGKIITAMHQTRKVRSTQYAA